MRVQLLYVVAAFVLLLLTVETHADEATDDASGWGRFGVDTMVHYRLTTEMTLPGRAPHRTVQETKKTLARITETHYVLKVETLLQGSWTTTEEKIPKDRTSGALSKIIPFAAGLDTKREDLGKEAVTVDGQAYECQKAKLIMTTAAGPGPSGAARTITVTIWEHPRHGLLKMEPSGEWGMGLEVTNLDEPFRLGDVSLTCKASTLTQSRMHMTTRRLDSTEVPEDLVRSEMTMDQGPTKSRTVQELIAFTKKDP